MSNTDTGGPAFPSHGSMGEVAHEGMTLRDYFAAKALGSLLNVLAMRNLEVTPENIAALAYKRADAMMKARDE